MDNCAGPFARAVLSLIAKDQVGLIYSTIVLIFGNGACRCSIHRCPITRIPVALRVPRSQLPSQRTTATDRARQRVSTAGTQAACGRGPGDFGPGREPAAFPGEHAE